MAAQCWHVGSADLVAADGKVANSKTKQSIAYGDLTRGQQLVTLIPDEPTLTPAKDWRIAGTSAPKVDGRAFVTGEHKYTSE